MTRRLARATSWCRGKRRGGRRGQRSGRGVAVWKEVLKDPLSLPPSHMAFISERCCSRERLLFWTISPSPIKKTEKKSAGTRMLLRGDTTPSPRLWLCPLTTNFTTITTTTTLQVQTSLLYLLHCFLPPPPHLFSRALWTVRCCQARAERREGERSWHCGASSALEWQYHPPRFLI